MLASVPARSGAEKLMKVTGKRIFSAISLTVGAVALYLVLSRPQPIATVQEPATAMTNAQSFDDKLAQLQSPRTENSAPAEVHFTSDEVSARMAESVELGNEPAANDKPSGAAAPISPDATVAPGQVQVKSYQVKLDGDVARGQFVTQVAGKDLYVTLAGHLGSQDGYVTFDPTEFKVGEMSIPVSLVNSALRKRLSEQRDQLKLPDGIAGLRVENGELVITQK